jgi:hypothetical protein
MASGRPASWSWSFLMLATSSWQNSHQVAQKLMSTTRPR